MEHPITTASDSLFDDGLSPPAQEGERLGRYLLRREIGRGFSSVVFEAQDLQRQRTVALKVLTFLQNLSPERRGDLSERFAREARAISALSHPSIVAIYEVGHADDGREFIAMELLAGETLRARLQREGTLPPAESVTITLQLADALQYAHERGIVHRDVKPDNVFVLPDGRIKLMDFGVAHVLSDEALTQTGTVVGSPAYMSPEQINGEHLDGRSDVFSLGVVLAEMVVGHKPFEAPTIPAVMHRILNRPPQMEAVSPRSLRRIIEKALSKSRQTRFQSAALLADALRRQVLPELPVWEPTSTMVMPVPSLPALSGRSAGAEWGATGERRSSFPITRWGLAAGATLAAALSLGFLHPSAHLAPALLAGRSASRLSQSPSSTVPATMGVVRHIPAYWRRQPASPRHRAARGRWAAKPTDLSQPLPRPASRPATPVQIVENKTPVFSNIVPLSPSAHTGTPAAPSRPAAPAVAKPPQLAVTAPVRTASSPSTPRLRPLIFKVAGFRQEQTLAPPTIAPDRPSPTPADQDTEQIGPADAAPSSQDAPPNPPSGDGIPDSVPRLLHRTPTLYPRSVPDSELGGVVTLRVFVDEDGNVSHVVVAHSSGIPDMDEAAIRTVKDWEYEPAFRGGRTVPGVATARIRFTP